MMPPRLELVAPGDLIQGALQSMGSQAEAKGVRLQNSVSPGLPQVRADRGQIVRVLVNLLNNAVRHTPGGGEVTLNARSEGSQVIFTVRDTGSGIPKEYLPRIFERFVQVPGATRGGGGLGLSIASSIVRAHGGEITAASEPGLGSAFEFGLLAVPLLIQGTGQK